MHNLAQQMDAAFVQPACFRRLLCIGSSEASSAFPACGSSASLPRLPFIGDRHRSFARMSTDSRMRRWRRRQDGGLCRDTVCMSCVRQDETRESHFSGSCAAPTLLADGRWPLVMTGQTKTHLLQPWRWAEPPSGSVMLLIRSRHGCYPMSVRSHTGFGRKCREARFDYIDKGKGKWTDSNAW